MNYGSTEVAYDDHAICIISYGIDIAHTSEDVCAIFQLKCT